MSNQNLAGKTTLHDGQGELDAAIGQRKKTKRDLSRKIELPAAPGVCYPYIIDAPTNTDEYEIDVETLVQTIPTVGPLHGNFEMNIDFFRIKARHYNPILHNVPVNIARRMDKVLLPQAKVTVANPSAYIGKPNQQQVASDSVIKYLGTSGFGQAQTTALNEVQRLYNVVPLLGYYEIIKNYYANKQEGVGYIIDPTPVTKTPSIKKIEHIRTNGEIGGWLNPEISVNTRPGATLMIAEGESIRVFGNGLNPRCIIMKDANTDNELTLEDLSWGSITVAPDATSMDFLGLKTNGGQLIECWTDDGGTGTGAGPTIWYKTDTTLTVVADEVRTINQFELDNVDLMRKEIMGWDGITTLDILSGTNAGRELPYQAALGPKNKTTYLITGATTTAAVAGCAYPMAGLCLKTYKGDRFNSWINKDNIEYSQTAGNLSVESLSAIDVITATEQIKFSDVIAAKATYDLVNRIVMGGDSLNDWHRAHYGTEGGSETEIPTYCGGVKTHIMFQDITSTAATEQEPHGSLAGKGYDTGTKKKKIKIEAKEQEFLMAIISITPKIAYGQGNRFFTRWETPTDWHSPRWDNLEWQDLLTDEMHAADTRVDADNQPIYNAVGKQAAWIEQTTAYDEVFGDFCPEENLNFMVLTRNYEMTPTNDLSEFVLNDTTTYIDPRKHNYAFANTELTAQNFWVQIRFNIEAKKQIAPRLMPML